MKRSIALGLVAASLAAAVATTATGATGTSYRAAIYSIRDDGTARRLVARPDPPVTSLVRSPGGRSILYVTKVGDDWALFAADTSGTNAVRLSPPGFSASLSQAAFSPDGRTIAFSSYFSCDFRCLHYTLYLVGRDGSGLRELSTSTNRAPWPSWASDSHRLTYAGPDGIYVTDLEGDETAVVAGGFVSRPVWAPRGERTAYTATIGGYGTACFVNADGSRRRCTHGHSLTSLVWSPDGKRVAFHQANPRRLGIVDSYARHVRSLGNLGRQARAAAWSPDGTRLAYWFGIYGSFGGRVVVIRLSRPRLPVLVVDERPGYLSELRWRGRRISYVVQQPQP
jgi:Tol biopolymer transport system component